MRQGENEQLFQALEADKSARQPYTRVKSHFARSSAVARFLFSTHKTAHVCLSPVITRFAITYKSLLGELCS